MTQYSTRTKVEIFPDEDWSETQVEQVRQGHLAAGALRCEKSRTANNTAWKLTTTWATLAPVAPAIPTV